MVLKHQIQELSLFVSLFSARGVSLGFMENRVLVSIGMLASPMTTEQKLDCLEVQDPAARWPEWINPYGGCSG